MKLAELVDRELKKREVRSLKAASQLIGISAELIRAILVKGHIPKDRTLRSIAQNLELDLSLLIVLAHQEKIPEDVKGHFLLPLRKFEENGKRKRKLPLSQEQCEYLERVISSEEIQLVRKYRQLSDEGKIQSRGYIEYIYGTAKQPAADQGSSLCCAGGTLAVNEGKIAEACS